ncbi:MAG: DUF58 domain-containing protein [Gammaproteobacteria bacterium]|nr:DUF58 domain-containing protein [Gammaproteobacteria bacterium]MCW8986518.1 DUF58 domain-containing protein [Gammaproteobacteria bacterium]
MIASVASEIINKIYQSLPLPFLKDDKKAAQPLLSNDEIVDLFQRVNNIKNSGQQKYDIAHKKTGDQRSIYRGLGMDYEESRRYQPGDDPRYMNWQLSARTGQHYIKIFREERQPGIFIIMDRRNSMRFGTQQRLKITQAARTAAIIAFSALQNNFSVGGVILDEKLEWFKENQSKQAIFDFIHQAARATTPCFDKKNITKYGIDDVMHMLTVILTKGSIIYFISDFYDLNDESQTSLFELTSSHQLNAIQITDPAEVKLPVAGTLILKSSNDDSVVSIDSNSGSDSQRFEFASNNYFSSITNILEKSGVSYQQVLTTISNIEHEVKF